MMVSEVQGKNGRDKCEWGRKMRLTSNLKCKLGSSSHFGRLGVRDLDSVLSVGFVVSCIGSAGSILVVSVMELEGRRGWFNEVEQSAQGSAQALMCRKSNFE